MSEAPEIVRAWPATVWVTGPLSAVKVLQCAQAATPILARSRKTEVVRTGDWVAKRSRAPFGVGAIRLTAAPVRRRRGFEAARYLNARGVSVPAVAGYVEWSYFGVVVRNALVMEFLEGYEPIRDYEQSIAGDVSAAERLLDRLRDAVVSIDRARAYHSDLAVKNVMVRDDRIVFIDMDAVRIEYDQTDFDRQRNCVQLLDGFYDLWPERVRLTVGERIAREVEYPQKWIEDVMVGLGERIEKRRQFEELALSRINAYFQRIGRD